MTPDAVFHAIFIVGLCYYLFGVYGPSVRRYRTFRLAQAASRPMDLLLDFATFLTWQVFPLVHILTAWLDSADYNLSPWLGALGVALFASAIFVLRQAYADLGANWSPKIDVLQEQELVTHGVYGSVRHPIYVGMWLWVVAQPLLIHNWIAGLGFLATFLPLYLLRVPREEQTLMREFGRAYLDYMAKTPRLFPRLRRRDRPS